MTALRVPAIQYLQSGSRKLYSFVVDVKRLPEIARVSMIRREEREDAPASNELVPEEASLAGYQRPEVVRHINGIKRYLETDEAPMIPNALVVAFDDRVKFEPLDGAEASAGGTHGTLVIPIDADDPCGFLVDGQQRTAAIRDAEVDSFPMNVTAFVASSEAEQRAQFILVNNSKPLPAGLVHELLPGTNGTLPRKFARRRFPAQILELLNHDPTSPFYGRIKTSTNPSGVLSHRAVLRMIEDSLAEGVLYRYRDPQSGEGDVSSMRDVLYEFWTAVSDVFPEAWGEEEPASPRKSRLVHGAGLRSMGFLMDAIADRHWDAKKPTYDHFRPDLVELAEHFRWTNGHWEFGPGQIRKWNELQNTSKDIKLLTNHILNLHRELVWDREPARSTA